MTARVVILDYGSGNLRSAERAVARTGADVTVTSDLAAAAGADGLVVPGVGAYAACMAGIDELGAGPVIAERVAAGRPVLGICVGMQIMFDSGVEHGVETKGLGLLPGSVTRLHAERIPHMGWNTVTVPAGSRLLSGLAPDTRFYFVHSYAAQDLEALSAATVTTAAHDQPFAAVVEAGALSVAQFHPEKSADAGYTLLGNWVKSLP
ncbi:imidazole glycerol phosphate synthase subunit HisH [Actinoplanes regularis]|uniref:Imidazole glycerol phosphate synthase subunit HisH n=1 Tax=Actinoplanes regularis TaxID=52697 RepID=A0A238WF82_9ACTN|nr:imidazole glycerol phosphate synthase subunit HisH [Actinoplanes regularis]GIE84943.1 imidazole glycerol phosphate synthase subunit HisH [Actinoplanes regularis]GLW27129.1 imidazole glycerol phosphate synthase subunit HisH [Actinoplanes regularis]SNR45225.1 imidazole glycerol phosphate synthase subunit hisH [Actinoplanes regularis]